jgi:Dihydrofolate reductase
MAEGVTIVNSIDAALSASEQYDEVMIIGGASFYQQMLPMVDRLYITLVHQTFEADAFFPDINMNEWAEIERREYAADERHAYDFSFVTFEKTS